MENHSFLSLLIVSGLAFSVPLIASLIPRGLVPIVVAEVLVGIVFGQSGFNLIVNSEWINFLSLFGFALLMFLSGLEVDASMLRPSRSGTAGRGHWVDNPLIAGIVIFVLTFCAAALAARLIYGSRPVAHILLTGLVLSTTSVGIVVPTLKERGLTGHRLGQTILLAAVVADFATMFLITILAGMLGQRDVWQLSFVLLLFVAFFAVLAIGSQPWIASRAGQVLTRLTHATAQIDVRGALALLVAFVVLAEAVRAEMVLAAFLAGAAIAALSKSHGHSLRAKLDAIGYGFFVPIFFITAGARFNLDALKSGSSVVLVALLFATAFLVKVLPSLILRLRYSWRESVAAGALLSARLSLVIAASAIGLRLGVVDEATNSALILIAVGTCLVSPAVFNLLIPRASPAPGVSSPGDVHASKPAEAGS